MRRSTRQRSMPTRVQDCEVFLDNKVTDSGDLVHFELIVEYEPVNSKEALSDQKWICAMKKELESIENNKTLELVDLPQGKKAIDVSGCSKSRQITKVK